VAASAAAENRLMLFMAMASVLSCW
jgi:hypothetical protein